MLLRTPGLTFAMLLFAGIGSASPILFAGSGRNLDPPTALDALESPVLSPMSALLGAVFAPGAGGRIAGEWAHEAGSVAGVKRGFRGTGLSIWDLSFWLDDLQSPAGTEGVQDRPILASAFIGWFRNSAGSTLSGLRSDFEVHRISHDFFYYGAGRDRSKLPGHFIPEAAAMAVIGTAVALLGWARSRGGRAW